MRILIVSLFFPPLNSIASHRPYSWAKYWTLAGHDVTVLTQKHERDGRTDLNFPNPGYKVIEVAPHLFFQRLKKKYHETLPKEEEEISPQGLKQRFFNLVDYLRFKKGIFNACRMPDSSDWWVSKAYHAAMKEKPWDLIISSAGPYTVHIVAEKLKKSGAAPKWIADYRDTWSDNYLYPGLFPFNLYERYLENKLLKSADMITTVSEPFAEYYHLRKPEGKIVTIENGFDLEDLNPKIQEPFFPHDGIYRIVHTGSLYSDKRDPSELFKALRLLSRDPATEPLLRNLEILFIGHRQGNLDALIDKYRVKPWVKLFGLVSRDRSLQLQREANALLFLPWNDPSVDGILTGKIFEYLASGTPILAVGCPEMEASQKLILEANAGVLLPRAEQIKEFLANELRTVTKKSTSISQALLARYDRKFLAHKLLNSFIT